MLPMPAQSQQRRDSYPPAKNPQVYSPRSMPRWLIILVFCLFAGTIAETFVTASTSPAYILLHPYSVPFNVLFYGAFDLLAREVIVRRRAGLASIMLLGAAYGFINEGVAAGTWYVVHPQGYIFIGGVDWVWALALTLFHAIVSVVTPIAFIEVLFPSIHGQPLLRRRGIVICAVLLLACVSVAILALAPLPLAIFPYRLAVLGVATLFTLVAVALPSRQPGAFTSAASLPPSASEASLAIRRPPGLWRLRLAGFLAMFGFFFLSYLVPVIVAALLQSQSDGLLIAQGIDAALLVAFGALVIALGWSWSQLPGWSPRQNLALLIGGVTFTTLLNCLTEAALGMPFSTIPFYLLLIALTIRWWRRASTTALPSVE